MRAKASLFLAAFLTAAALLGTTLAADAQQPYQPYPYSPQPYPYYQVSPSPPSAWNYDPYTSGMTACPQRGHRDPPCSETLFPTYGQPDYRR
jgi:hypothetical protein